METADLSNPCIKKVPYTASPLSVSREFQPFSFRSVFDPMFRVGRSLSKMLLETTGSSSHKEPEMRNSIGLRDSGPESLVSTSRSE